MMERQEYWVQKKKLAIEAQRAEKEKENNNFSFKPDVGNSKRTYKASESVRQVVPGMATTVTAVCERTSGTESKASGSKWGAVRAKLKGGDSSGKKKAKHTGRTKPGSSSGEKVKKGSSEKVVVKAPLATAMSVARAATGKDQSPPSSANNDPGRAHAASEPCPDVGDDEGDHVGNGPHPDVSDDGYHKSETPNCIKGNENFAPFVPGSFWWKVENGRGHHRVRDGSVFQMWSIYRKKDKSKDVKGVSILVGRMEEPPYEEHVIQMMWDIEEWTEEASFHWWNENGHRYRAAAT
jgi:hypothetical protein